MAGTSESLLQTQTLNSLYTALDPKSLLLSQFSNSDQPQFLQLTTDSFLMERGPRYKAYADLREKKLRIKHMKQSIPEEEEEEKDYRNEVFVLTPPKKQVKFQGNFVTPPKRTKGSSILTQSVPDFSSALRKENRKPPTMLPTLKEKSATPPPAGSKSGKFYGVVGNIGGSKSVNSGDKRNGGLITRKSYANVEELKGLATVARSAINGENRVGRNSSRIAGKTILGYRQL
ncbi:uncharacterized protein LOC142171651 [Nicotiana tabacum]|uniref:Uncharacterized protein LOC142171651 n=1 Tax=Nicotiana tabacum TaxID=4097 RepID=A0AC58T297_TOBAC|nr:uncharacterized protein LOC104104420 [Nicotiana tomentosiformis]